MAESLRQKVFSGTLWMVFMSGGQQVLSFLVQLVLARLLVPHDYGVAAIVMTIGGLASVFASAGVSTAIVQRKEILTGLVDAVAWTTLGVALLLGGILVGSSSLFASYYHEPSLVFLLRLVSVDVVLKVVLSLYDSLMLRRMLYRALSVRTVIGLVFQSVVSIYLANKGYGPKALVFGYVVGTATQLLLCVWATRYIPSSSGDWNGVGDLFKFGFWVLLGRFANQLAMTLDQLVIARVLNTATLGLVNVSKQLTGIVPSAFMGVIGRVSLPVFSRWQDDIGRIEESYWRGLRLNMMIIFPLCAEMGLFAHQMLAVMYGSKWIQAVDLMRVFSFVVAMETIDAGYTGAVLNATGRPRCIAFIMVLSLPILPLCVWVGSRWGAMGIAWSLLSYAILFFLINQLVLRSQLKFSFRAFPASFLRASLSLLPMLLVGRLLVRVGFLPVMEPPAVLSKDWFLLGTRLAGSCIACLLAYVLTIRCTMKNDFIFLNEGLKGIVHRRKNQGGNHGEG